MSLIIVQVGETGSGKTRNTKMIFDWFPKKEWYVLDPKKQFLDDNRFKQINPRSDLKIVLPQIYDSVVCIDEAAIRFPLAATNPEIVEMLLSCRHNYTITILNFHAFQQVPIYIRNYINIICVGRTNDDIKQAGKFGKRSQKVYEAMQAVENSNDDHPWVTIF